MISFLVSVVKDFAELVSDKYKAMMMKLSLQITGSREDRQQRGCGRGCSGRTALSTQKSK